MPHTPTLNRNGSPSYFTLSHPLSFFSLITLSLQASRRRRGGESSAEENLDDVYKVFDAAGTGRIPAEQVGTLIRASGKNPTQAEVEAMIEECGGKDIFSFYLWSFLFLIVFCFCFCF